MNAYAQVGSNGTVDQLIDRRARGAAWRCVRRFPHVAPLRYLVADVLEANQMFGKASWCH